MLEEKLGEYMSLILPDHQTEARREPTLEENEVRFMKTAELAAAGWLPPPHEYKGETSRTPFNEEHYREIAGQIVSELKDNSQN